MKIATASTGYDMDSPVSTILGTSTSFIIVDIKNGEIKEVSVIKNPRKLRFGGVKNHIFNSYAKNKSGSGSIAAQLMVDNEVNVLITGKLGPVAFHILKNAGIKVYKFVPGSVETNLKRFIGYKLEEVTSLSGGFPE